MSRIIYCISGLGADEKVFCNLRVNGFQLKCIPWLRPYKNEPIDTYAARMSAQIQEPAPLLLGVSFGGMIGIEIAKQRPLSKLIVISSVKSIAELPRWMKLAGRLQLNKMLPIRSYKFTEKIDNHRLGVSSAEERELVRFYRRNADPVYLTWAVNEVLNWKNEWSADTIIHIHGDQDKIFPIKKIRTAHIIKGGTHLMIYNRGKEISACLEELLSVDSTQSTVDS